MCTRAFVKAATPVETSFHGKEDVPESCWRASYLLLVFAVFVLAVELIEVSDAWLEDGRRRALNELHRYRSVRYQSLCL